MEEIGENKLIDSSNSPCSSKSCSLEKIHETSQNSEIPKSSSSPDFEKIRNVAKQLMQKSPTVTGQGFDELCKILWENFCETESKPSESHVSPKRTGLKQKTLDGFFTRKNSSTNKCSDLNTHGTVEVLVRDEKLPSSNSTDPKVNYGCALSVLPENLNAIEGKENFKLASDDNTDKASTIEMSQELNDVASNTNKVLKNESNDKNGKLVKIVSYDSHNIEIKKLGNEENYNSNNCRLTTDDQITTRKILKSCSVVINSSEMEYIMNDSFLKNINTSLQKNLKPSKSKKKPNNVKKKQENFEKMPMGKFIVKKKKSSCNVKEKKASVIRSKPRLIVKWPSKNKNRKTIRSKFSLSSKSEIWKSEIKTDDSTKSDNNVSLVNNSKLFSESVNQEKIAKKKFNKQVKSPMNLKILDAIADFKASAEICNDNAPLGNDSIITLCDDLVVASYVEIQNILQTNENNRCDVILSDLETNQNVNTEKLSDNPDHLYDQKLGCEGDKDSTKKSMTQNNKVKQLNEVDLRENHIESLLSESCSNAVAQPKRSESLPISVSLHNHDNVSEISADKSIEVEHIFTTDLDKGTTFKVSEEDNAGKTLSKNTDCLDKKIENLESKVGVEIPKNKFRSSRKCDEGPKLSINNTSDLAISEPEIGNTSKKYIKSSKKHSVSKKPFIVTVSEAHSDDVIYMETLSPNKSGEIIQSQSDFINKPHINPEHLKATVQQSCNSFEVQIKNILPNKTRKSRCVKSSEKVKLPNEVKRLNKADVRKNNIKSVLTESCLNAADQTKQSESLSISESLCSHDSVSETSADKSNKVEHNLKTDSDKGIKVPEEDNAGKSLSKSLDKKIENLESKSKVAVEIFQNKLRSSRKCNERPKLSINNTASDVALSEPKIGNASKKYVKSTKKHSVSKKLFMGDTVSETNLDEDLIYMKTLSPDKSSEIIQSQSDFINKPHINPDLKVNSKAPVQQSCDSVKVQIQNILPNKTRKISRSSEKVKLPIEVKRLNKVDVCENHIESVLTESCLNAVAQLKQSESLPISESLCNQDNVSETCADKSKEVEHNLKTDSDKRNTFKVPEEDHAGKFLSKKTDSLDKKIENLESFSKVAVEIPKNKLRSAKRCDERPKLSFNNTASDMALSEPEIGKTSKKYVKSSKKLFMNNTVSEAHSDEDLIHMKTLSLDRSGEIIQSQSDFNNKPHKSTDFNTKAQVEQSCNTKVQIQNIPPNKTKKSRCIKSSEKVILLSDEVTCSGVISQNSNVTHESENVLSSQSNEDVQGIISKDVQTNLNLLASQKNKKYLKKKTITLKKCAINQSEMVHDSQEEEYCATEDVESETVQPDLNIKKSPESNFIKSSKKGNKSTKDVSTVEVCADKVPIPLLIKIPSELLIIPLTSLNDKINSEAQVEKSSASLEAMQSKQHIFTNKKAEKCRKLSEKEQVVINNESVEKILDEIPKMLHPENAYSTGVSKNIINQSATSLINHIHDTNVNVQDSNDFRDFKTNSIKGLQSNLNSFTSKTGKKSLEKKVLKNKNVAIAETCLTDTITNNNSETSPISVDKTIINLSERSKDSQVTGQDDIPKAVQPNIAIRKTLTRSKREKLLKKKPVEEICSSDEPVFFHERTCPSESTEIVKNETELTIDALLDKSTIIKTNSSLNSSESEKTKLSSTNKRAKKNIKSSKNVEFVEEFFPIGLNNEENTSRCILKVRDGEDNASLNASKIESNSTYHCKTRRSRREICKDKLSNIIGAEELSENASVSEHFEAEETCSELSVGKKLENKKNYVQKNSDTATGECEIRLVSNRPETCDAIASKVMIASMHKNQPEYFSHLHSSSGNDQQSNIVLDVTEKFARVGMDVNDVFQNDTVKALMKKVLNETLGSDCCFLLLEPHTLKDGTAIGPRMFLCKSKAQFLELQNAYLQGGFLIDEDVDVKKVII